jgi:hypothetical protein
MKSRKKRWEGHVAYKEERKTAYRVLVEKYEGTRPVVRPRCRWEGNIDTDLQEMTRDMDWIDLAQGRDRW